MAWLVKLSDTRENICVNLSPDDWVSFVPPGVETLDMFVPVIMSTGWDTSADFAKKLFSDALIFVVVCAPLDCDRDRLPPP